MEVAAHWNPQEPALYLAAQIRARYDLSERATYEQLLAVAEKRGVAVFVSPHLSRRGAFVPWPYPLIQLRWDRDPWVLAHELYHAIIHTNQTDQIIYSYPDFASSNDDEEWQAQLFARALCGDERERGRG